MRAAAILGLKCSPKILKSFRDDETVRWRIGMPASADEADIVLLFGGDGTIHRHLGQLVKLGLPVLIVPAGSGNDFARALGLRSVRDSVAAWRKFRQNSTNLWPIDLGIVTPLTRQDEQYSATRSAAAGGQQYFCCVAGVGLDCEVARRANQLPSWMRAHGGYVLSLAPSVFRFAAVPVRLWTSFRLSDKTSGDENEASFQIRSNKPTILAAFANTSTYGGGMKIAPKARLDDGLLDICVVGGMPAFKLFCMFPMVYSGGHLGINEVEYFQASHLRVETDRPLDVYADGEYVCTTPIEVTVAKAALRVVVPEKF